MNSTYSKGSAKSDEMQMPNKDEFLKKKWAHEE